MEELAIMSAIAYYTDRQWEWREVQLAFDKVDSHIFFYFQT